VITTVLLGSFVVWLVYRGSRRKTLVKLPPEAVLAWEEGIEDQDSYRVCVRAGASKSILFDHDDPARVIGDLRRVCVETGRRCEGPEWLRVGMNASAPGSRRIVLITGSDEGPRWLAQRDAAWAVVAGGVFVLLIFLGSVRWEARITWLGALLPLASVALALCIGAALFSLRIRVSANEEGIRVERVVFGRSRQLLEISRRDLLSARAVGHTGYPPRHLLFETVQGPRAIAIAGATAALAAERVRAEPSSDAPAHAASHARTTPESREFLSRS
jgi:hypothetical protein